VVREGVNLRPRFQRDRQFVHRCASYHRSGARPRGQDETLWLADWTLDHGRNRPSRRRHTAPGVGEIHFGWVLEGRAIQDVWILPGVFYGTTLRVYDPGLDAWHILWSDPLRQFYTRQIGRAQGDDIVQEGTNEAGEAVRWSFTKITRDAFRWIGERSSDGGKTWQLQAEYSARRAP
jgi:hypothetical protein